MNKDKRPESDQTLHEELQTLRQILKAIFDSTKSSIFLISPDFRIIFFNKWAADGCKLLYGCDMRIGDSILDYRHEGDEVIFDAFRENFERSISTKGPVISEREMCYPHTSLWIKSEYTTVFSDDNKVIGVLLNVQNISDKKKFEIENEEKAKRLSEIAWSQSHETRQPVATLLGLINILEKKSMTTENLKIINLLEETALKLEKVIRQNVIRANKHLQDHIE